MARVLKRCALYTRKSSEEGLEQDFNSLDAQREACAAYVKSQSSEGWRAVSARYDDGGQSGGSMDRPALQRLLADIAAGLVDIVVVYKIDRLTRSLADFARMVELFDRHGVSFVSVTQAFNTTNSMGRLTLNVLLSFAQFEREVTGERIRDKIAASKAKGMWMGGMLPLGYGRPAAGSRALRVNPGEAETVRTIFAAYFELGSVHALEARLRETGIRSKQWTTSKGRLRGGSPFSRGALFHLLRNRTYLGMIVHGDRVHPGMHEAIVGEDLFEAVQARLGANTRRRGERRDQVAQSTLAGRIFDCDGAPMSPTMARGRHGRYYRYYVSAPLQQGRRRVTDDGAPRRISARIVETRIAGILHARGVSKTQHDLRPLMRVEVHAETLHLLMPVDRLPALRERLGDEERAEADAADPARLRFIVPARLHRRGGRTVLIGADEPARRPDPVLVNALRSAHRLIDSDRSGLPLVDRIPASPYDRRLMRLAFLSPDLQRAILEGSQSADLNLARLMENPVPPSWAEQQSLFGAGATG